MISFSRSEYETLLDCRRKWYWAYGYPKALTGGIVDGLERKAIDLPLATGTHTHIAIAELLKGQAASVAAQAGVDSYLTESKARGLATELPEDAQFTLDEQCALVRAVTHAFARVKLLPLLSEYDVEAVEAEEEASWDGIKFLARPDALLRRKSDGIRFLLSLKTASDCSSSWARRFETDLQTLSEIIPVEARLGEKLGGVIVIGLQKGKRFPDENRETGEIYRYRSRSPLLYGYKFDGNPPLEPVRYDHNYTRAKGWHRFNVWEETFDADLDGGPVAFWTNWLHLEVVESQIVTLHPIVRSEALIESWKKQASHQVEDADVGAGVVRNSGSGYLDPLFPQNFSSCQRFSKCPMFQICWEPGTSENPVESGLYQARKANHPSEAHDVSV